MSRRSSPGPDDRAADNPALYDATTVLTATPALLGFVPEHSFVFLVFGTGGIVRVTMRHDLIRTADGAMSPIQADVIDHLGAVAARHHDVRSVVMVVADDRHPHGDPCYRAMMSTAHRSMRAVGGLACGFVVTEFVAGAEWSRVWHPDAQPGMMPPGPVSGVLDDPHTCPTAISEAVRRGRRLLLTRSEMEAMLRPARHCANASCTSHHPSRATDPELLQALMDELNTHRTDRGCAHVHLLEEAITRTPVRDAALGLAVTDRRYAAEQLWRDLTRRLTGEGRAAAATLLAHLHYIGGEGTYAGVALDCALRAAPGWPLADLLDQALRQGMPPDDLWPMIADSYDAAAALGVILEPSTLDDAC